MDLDYLKLTLIIWFLNRVIVGLIQF